MKSLIVIITPHDHTFKSSVFILPMFHLIIFLIKTRVASALNHGNPQIKKYVHFGQSFYIFRCRSNEKDAEGDETPPHLDTVKTIGLLHA